MFQFFMFINTNINMKWGTPHHPMDYRYPTDFSSDTAYMVRFSKQ